MLIMSITFFQCSNPSSTAKKTAVDSNTTKGLVSSESILLPPPDSVQLTELVRNLYKWFETEKMALPLSFSPVENSVPDTVYHGIDLAENSKAIAKLRQTGFFTESFLADYRKIAVRMDKELRSRSVSWLVGDMSPFGKGSNEWCNCQDYPDNYWDIIKLVDIRISKDKAGFKWTWGDNLYYAVRAKREARLWKISYLEGFDMKAYNWSDK